MSSDSDFLEIQIFDLLNEKSIFKNIVVLLENLFYSLWLNLVQRLFAHDTLQFLFSSIRTFEPKKLNDKLSFVLLFTNNFWRIFSSEVVFIRRVKSTSNKKFRNSRKPPILHSKDIFSNKRDTLGTHLVKVYPELLENSIFLNILTVFDFQIFFVTGSLVVNYLWIRHSVSIRTFLTCSLRFRSLVFLNFCMVIGNCNVIKLMEHISLDKFISAHIWARYALK